MAWEEEVDLMLRLEVGPEDANDSGFYLSSSASLGPGYGV
jgi:hypothetical protein